MTQGIYSRINCDRCDNAEEKPYGDHIYGKSAAGDCAALPENWSSTEIRIAGKPNTVGSRKVIHLCPVCSEFLDLFFPDKGQQIVPEPNYSVGTGQHLGGKIGNVGQNIGAVIDAAAFDKAMQEKVFRDKADWVSRIKEYAGKGAASISPALGNDLSKITK